MHKLNMRIFALLAALLVMPQAHAEVYKWSQTPSSNSTSDTGSDIQWAEGMAPSDVNDSARAMMTELRKWIDDLGAYATASTMQTTAGSSTAYTLTTEGSADNLENGRIVCAYIHATSGASPTLNVDSLGAKPIYGIDDTAVPQSAIPINTLQCFSYSTVSNSASGAWIWRQYRPVDASTIGFNSTTGAIERGELTGDVTASQGSSATDIASGVVGTTELEDGGVATGDIADSAVSTAKIADDAVTGDKIDTSSVYTVPVGTVLDFVGDTCPANTLAGYAQDVSRTTYAALYAVTGNTYGAGDGSTTFTMPDLRGRVTVGKDDAGGISANRVTTTLNGDVLGATGGEERHTMTIEELVEHRHAYSGTTGNQSNSHTHFFSDSSNTNTTGNHDHESVRLAFGNTDAGTGANRVSGYTNDTTGTQPDTGDAGNHAHSVTISGNTGNQSASHNHLYSGDTEYTGNTTPFNVMQPSIVLMKCIYTGV